MPEHPSENTDETPRSSSEGQTVDFGQSGPERVEIFSGHALTTQEGNALAASVRTRVIALVGPIESGKTTLVLQLYEAFRKGRVQGCAFGGSRTLLGFEERCHLSRDESQGKTDDTERTKADAEEVLLHLRLLPPDAATAIDLAFWDLSGELFSAAGDSNEALEALPFLSTAYRVVMLLDGERLLDRAKRFSVRQQFFTLLRAAVEMGRFGLRTDIDVVFSKQDIVGKDERLSEAREFQRSIERECTERFGASLGRLSFHLIAARPEPDEGLRLLFQSWLNEKEASQVKPTTDYSRVLRQMDRFGARIS